MKRLALVAAVLALTACSKDEPKPADTGAAMSAPPAAAAAAGDSGGMKGMAMGDSAKKADSIRKADSIKKAMTPPPKKPPTP